MRVKPTTFVEHAIPPWYLYRELRPSSLFLDQSIPNASSTLPGLPTKPP